MNKDKFKATFIIILLLLIAATTIYFVTGSRRSRDYYYHGSDQTPDPISQAVQTVEPTARPLPTPAPTPAPTMFIPTPEPENTVVTSPDPAAAPSAAPAAVPAVPVNGSGRFSSDTGSLIDIDADWKLSAIDDGNIAVDVTVTLNHYSLYMMEANSLHISLGDNYQTLKVPAVSYDGKGLMQTVLGTYTFREPLSAGQNVQLPLAVNWEFGGNYRSSTDPAARVDLPVVECGGTVSVSR